MTAVKEQSTLARFGIPALWVIAFEAISMSIGMATQGGVDGWYAAAEHPSFSPPNIVFPIVWSSLYALVALAGHRIYKLREMPGGMANLALFCVYMAINWSWSFVFFSMQEIFAALLMITVMNIMTAGLILRLMRRDLMAALLLLPLLMWTCFAMVLNSAYL